MNRGPSRTFRTDVRLRRRREFLAVYDEGVRVVGVRLVVFVLPTRLGRARLGLTAMKKVGAAAARNRLRRQLRDAFRRNKERLDSWDIVINIRSEARGQPTHELEREFLALARRARRALARPQRGGPR